MNAPPSRKPYLADTKTCVDPPRWGASGGLSTRVLQGRQFDMALSVGTRLGPYEIEAVIGAGGMGEVYQRGTRVSAGRLRSRFFPERSARIPTAGLGSSGKPRPSPG